MLYLTYYPGFICVRPCALEVKNPPANTGDVRDAGSIPGSGRSPGEGHGKLTPVFLLENSMGRGAIVHGVAKSWA